MNNRVRAGFCFLFLAVIWVFSCERSFGDTIIKKDKEMVKGVIVEDYKDRVVISTIDGEKKIMKGDIEVINYDLEEQNLTSMGGFYQDRGMYMEAYHYYNQALKISPNFKPAREGLDFSGAMLQQMGRKKKLEHISRMNEEKAWRSGINIAEESHEKKLKDELGFSVEPYGANFKVTSVQRSSPADDGGLRVGDIIVALWGRKVGYISVQEFISGVITPEMMEVKLTILRNMELMAENRSGNISGLLGVSIGYSETEGFEVKSVSPGGMAMKLGFAAGDTISEIEGRSTRYMTLEEMDKISMDKKGESLSVVIKRDLSLWKRFNKK
jgi:membrane-associated protease RseP (regulator of RpoE activity)